MNKTFFFICKNREHRRTGFILSRDDLADAEISLVELIQVESFDNLNNEKIKHLKPVCDESGLIRLKTKIDLRDDPFNFVCPDILPANHDGVNSIINDRHANANYAVVQIILSNMREKIWILGGRRTIRAVIERCVDCCRRDARPLEVTPAPLPLEKIREAAVFEIIGVDSTGPVCLKGGQKTWICIFTCTVFRAVHLELVNSLSVASFLTAFRRHIARRGRPSVIFSDNGTNFVGLSNELKKINFEKIAENVA